MRLLGALSLVFVCFLVTSSGQARSLLVVGLDAGTQTETVVSGTTGPIRQYIGRIAGAGMRGVEWAEQADIPCHFDSHMRDIGYGSTFTGYYFNGCGNTWGNTKTIIFSGAREFVRGIKICDNGNSNHRLKGIKLYKAKVWKTQALIDYVGSQTATHTNCSVWKNAVYCPAGKIATGMVLHVDPQTSPGFPLVVSADAAQGISLECQTVTWH